MWSPLNALPQRTLAAPCPHPPQTCLTLACPPDLSLQHSSSPSPQHSFLPIPEAFSDRPVLFPSPQEGKPRGQAVWPCLGGTSYPRALMVCGISSCLSPFCRKFEPRLREMWLSYSVSPSFASGAWTGSSQRLPEEVHRRWAGAAFQVPISANIRRLPAPTSKQRCLFQLRANGGADGLALAGATTGCEPSARSDCGSRAQRLIRAALLAWRAWLGCRADGEGRRPSSGKGVFRPESWVTAGVQGPSALRGVIARGVPRLATQLPAAQLACGCVPGSGPYTHEWGKDVWPQPAL